jgi:hypothetical protein
MAEDGIAAPGSNRQMSEDKALLQAVKAWSEDSRGAIDANAKMRAAALKMLRHVYLLSRSGNRQVWVHSLPRQFLDWPSDHFHSQATTDSAVKRVLRSRREQFNWEQKKYLSTSSQQALAWCQKTSMLLANAASTDKKAEKKRNSARDVVKRWFADPGTSDTDLTTYIGKLAKGFKDITATLNKGQLILTDWVPLRAASTSDELDFLNAEAFTFASKHEGLDVVYIEKSFFQDVAGNVLKGQKNWTRIVVHELTHLVCGTEDVKIGNARYAWYGIGPHSGFPGSAAVRNADSWAFFCADCAGVLLEAERNKALTIV